MNKDGLYQPIYHSGDTASSQHDSVLSSAPTSVSGPSYNPSGSASPRVIDVGAHDGDFRESTQPMRPGSQAASSQDAKSTVAFLLPSFPPLVGEPTAEDTIESTTPTEARMRLRVDDEVDWSVASWLRTQDQHSFAPGHLDRCFEEARETGRTEPASSEDSSDDSTDDSSDDSSGDSSDDSSVPRDGRFGAGGYQPPLHDAVIAANAAWEIHLGALNPVDSPPESGMSSAEDN
nr:uncharacterized protein LOC123003504 [Drosophila takahashii]